MEIDDSVRIVEDARRKEALDRMYSKVGEYIVEKFYSMIDSKSKGKYQLNLNSIEKDDMEKYLIANKKYEAKRLIISSKLEVDKILKGEADFEIFRQFNIIKAELMSVEQEKKKTTQELRTKKKQSERNKKIAKIVAAIAVAGTMVVTAVSLSDLVTEIKEDKAVDNAIGIVVSEHENDPRNIISQNTYTVGFDNRGFPIIAYDNEGIAKDILKVCSKNSQLFDICVYNAYDNMNYNRLENMDDVIKYLKIYTKDVVGLEDIYSRVDNCSVFLDYIVNRGFLNPNDNDYYQTLNDIDIYKGLKDKTDVAYSGLPDDSKERIDDLIKNYQGNKENLYSEYKDDLEGLGDFGSR